MYWYTHVISLCTNTNICTGIHKHMYWCTHVIPSSTCVFFSFLLTFLSTHAGMCTLSLSLPRSLFVLSVFIFLTLSFSIYLSLSLFLSLSCSLFVFNFSITLFLSRTHNLFLCLFFFLSFSLSFSLFFFLRLSFFHFDPIELPAKLSECFLWSNQNNAQSYSFSHVFF